MRIDAFPATDQGQRRETNEDQYLIDESLGLYIVCDGMGGHAAGEVAAERSVAFAAEHIRSHADVLAKASSTPDGYYRVLKLAENATQEASLRLYEQACTDTTLAGMGTTMTMLLVVDNKAVMAHVGDSRLYMMRGGKVHQLSIDHTLANDLLQAGRLTKEEAEVSRYNHVLTRSIGQQKQVHVESLLFDLFPGDTCLLCSDGLSNYFEDQAMVAEFLASEDLPSLADRFIEFANDRGGSDNITLIVLRVIGDSDDADSSDAQRRLDVLNSTFLCRGLTISRLIRVLNISAVVDCAPGQELLSAGQACDGMYVVLEGRLTVKDDPLLPSSLSSGDCLGQSTLLRPGKLHASVVVDEPTRLLFIPRSKFEKLCRRLPKLGSTLLKNLGQHLSEQLENLQIFSEKATEDTATFDDETK
jgi:serine/threonine protein phosphatase PrpC